MGSDLTGFTTLDSFRRLPDEATISMLVATKEDVEYTIDFSVQSLRPELVQTVGNGEVPEQQFASVAVSDC